MNGTWVEEADSSNPAELFLKDGGFEHSHGFKGTYAMDQHKIILTTTHIFHPVKVDDWMPVAETSNPHFYSDWIGTYSDNQLVFEASIYIKKQ